ncbi:hypothetical protein AB0E59_31595 [Lentzea sp. NPDC034063]|uniref:hypothetical protein n=1 Tax=unclassified Lentzea TaxID=2643253 RepID=UPI0034118E70
MSTPDSDFTPESFTYAAQQIVAGQLLSDPASIFLFSFLQSMSALSGPFSELLAVAYLGQIMPPAEAHDVVRTLNELHLIHEHHDPTAADVVHYKIDERFLGQTSLFTRHGNRVQISYEDESLNERREEIALLRTHLAMLLLERDQMAAPSESDTAWPTRLRNWLATKLDAGGGPGAEARLMGSSIDRTTDSFNEILNMLGPPPEATGLPVVTPIAPVGVS